MKRSKSLAALVFAIAIAVMGLIQLNTQTAYANLACCSCTVADNTPCNCSCVDINYTSTCKAWLAGGIDACIPQ